MNLNNLKNEIIQLPPKEPVFIYVGVGTAAGLVNSDGILEPTNYHQFPPFLQYVRKRITNLNLFLVLIDPRQENPPYMARDFPLIEIQIDEYQMENAENGSLHVFVFRKNVYTDTDVQENENWNVNNNNDDAVNITETLRDLNNFAIANQASLLYHDFTGRRTANLAEYFEYECENQYMDQIIYAMSARKDHGCYFDLTHSSSYYPIRLAVDLNTRPIIKMFNLYKFIANNKLYRIAAEQIEYGEEMQELIKVQKEHVADDISMRFKNIDISMLRQICKIILNPTDDIDPNLYLYNNITKSIRNIYLELFHKKEYQLLFDILYDYCEHQLEIYSHLKGLDISGQDMLKFITANEDPYKWYDSIKMFL